MGTEIPLVEYLPSNNQQVFSFFNTRLSLEDAVSKFKKVKELTIQLSMIENSAYRLAANIKKTQKRANALKNITIPYYTTLTINIENALEEKEREDFTRLKIMKQRLL
jgi:V/A-type H+-transporting ATPase subunit D